MDTFFEKHKKISYTLFAVGVLVLLLSPVFYLAIFSPTKFGEVVQCKTSANISYTQTTLKDVVLAPEDWENAGVYLGGKIFFAPISDKFYLRDGVWSISIDASKCENMDIFRNGAALVSIFGIIRLESDELVLVVDDIFETVPAPARTIFNAGVYGLIGLAILPITLFMRRIRIKKGWDPESGKEKKRQAFGPLFFGIMGAVAWLVNPVIGFFAFAFGIIAGRKFLRSPSRKLVITGMALCIFGIAGLGFLTANGTIAPNLGPNFFTAFEKSMGPGTDEKLPGVSQSADTGEQTIETSEPAAPSAPKVSTYLDAAPYVNKKLGFKIHPPKGWRMDESGQFGVPVAFFNTRTDMAGNTPFASNINVTFEPTSDSLNAYVNKLKAALPQALPGYTLVQEGTIKTNGIVAGLIISGAFDQNGMRLRNLQVIRMGNGKVYAVTATALESSWGAYQDMFEESLEQTFEVISIP